jgi:uncharacterized SAM-dependent methyltransferase
MRPVEIHDIGGSQISESLRSRLLNEFLHPLTGLRSLPTELFYDTVGLELWSHIVETVEYTQLRDEAALMGTNAATLANSMRDGTALLDMGSG